jgi:type II secretory pathway component PulF
MAVYAYKAVDLDASSQAGTVVADTARQARDLLRERGLTVTQIDESRRVEGPGLLRRRRGRAAQREVVGFVRELATLLRTGIPLLSALQTLARQHKGHFRAVIQDLIDQVAAGTALAEAMERHETYFDNLCVSIVSVGENTGRLESALGRLAEFKSKAHRLRSRVTTALIYPAVVCVVGLAVCLFLTTYVVPNLLDTLMQSDRPLPAITRAVKAISDFLRNWWWLLGLLVVGLLAGVQFVVRTDWGGLLADRLVLRIPVLGELVRKENTSRIAVVLSALLGSGLEFVEAIRITRRTLRNRVFRGAMDDYEAAILAGADVSAPLEATGVFRPMVVQMLAVGQQSGQLEEMLEQLAEAYDLEVATATQRLTSLLEPLLIVLLAILIAFIAFATILPIVEISNVL